MRGLKDGRLRNLFQEFRELGLDKTIFRLVWEINNRSGLAAIIDSFQRPARMEEGATLQQVPLPLAAPEAVRKALPDLLSDSASRQLQNLTNEALQGRLLCFGRWMADFSKPIDWHRHPLTGQRWPSHRHWSKTSLDSPDAGDIKMLWEIARFPQAYFFARAATLEPKRREELLLALRAQIESFIENNSTGQGPHWNAGLEVALRLMSWLFAFHALGCDIPRFVVSAMLEGASHIERNIDFARRSMSNDHLIAEALALYLVARTFPEAVQSPRWKTLGLSILTGEALEQFLPDGGCYLHSHNYHRAVLQLYLWLWCCLQADRMEPPTGLRRIMETSLDFLFQQQNPLDGRLPNYGCNDGSQFHLLSSCDYSDFRPTLQALSIATRGERIYEPGAWDEEALWLFGSGALESPLRPPIRRSASFQDSGYQILRGTAPGSFGTFRCGAPPNRFSQIDMLHLDLWWKGLNLLVDGGSFSYNGSQVWHNHFTRTASHNTVQVDNRDQMLHHRRFKCLYGARSELVRFEEGEQWLLCVGEHHGYRRHPGQVVHRRAVLFIRDDLWIVLDKLTGTGNHQARLHWLCGDFPALHDPAAARLSLSTPRGSFSIQLVDAAGGVPKSDLVIGREDAPRGWLSRYYGEKVPVPSLAAEVNAALPIELMSVLGAGSPTVDLRHGRWTISTERLETSFKVDAGAFSDIKVNTAELAGRHE